MSTRRAAAAVALLALALAGCVSREGGAPEAADSDERPSSSAGGLPAENECGYEKDEADTAHFVGLPPEDEPTEATTMALTTSAGPITIELDAEQAQCTVRSMAFLAEKGFYDGVNCHRLTAAEGLKVLQCGDPNGDGTGGPGYVIPDELESAQALPEAEAPDGYTQVVNYTRGTVAMANAGPDTGGSQFFLVYGDSTLPPNYTVFGRMDQAGLTTLDQIAAGGITPGANGAQDGSPVTRVTITKAQVS